MSFLCINKTLRLNNLKTRKDMNVTIPLFVIFVETIIYLLLYNLHGCIFKCIFPHCKSYIQWKIRLAWTQTHFRPLVSFSTPWKPEVSSGIKWVNMKKMIFNEVLTQQAITCSKLTIETIERCVKYVQR